MTNKVPPFPGKPAQTGGAAQPAWKNAICPFLTAGEVARTQQRMVQGIGQQNGGQVVAQPCLGPQCMMFIAMKTPTEEVAGCAPVHVFGQLHQLNFQVATFIEAAKAGAAAEAAKADGSTAVTDTQEALAPSPLTDAADAAERDS